MTSPAYDPQSRPDLVGPALRRSLTDSADAWLTSLLAGAGPGVALVAVGSLGRGELTPASDLDLLLLHDGRPDVGAVADRVWYPVWDSRVGLDHSVRTVAESLSAAREDLKVAVGLLDARLVAGDATLVEQLRSQHLARWRTDASRRLPELAAACRERAGRAGELAYLLEPDLKSSRGGLRDAQTLWQVAATQRTDRPGEAVLAAKALLLDVRGELARRGRGDRLTLQEQDAVAGPLGRADADALMAEVAAAARTIAYALDVTWRAVLPRERTAGARLRRGLFGRGAAREPVATGVDAYDGELVLGSGVRAPDDALLPLRVAAASASSGLPVSLATLDLLAECPPVPEPWPAPARDLLVATLATGPAALSVLEAYDQAGLWSRLLPEWEHTRSRPQRNAYHRFTVDRHLLEAASVAAGLTRTVGRPDLLLLGALLHDIGKGLPGDHTEVGMRIVGELGPRLGLGPADTATLVRLIQHHLLLADTAQRRDLDDPAVIAATAAAVGDVETLDLLAALTEADSRATGPAAWSRWKAGLLARLVERTRAVLGGGPPPTTALTAGQRALLEAHAIAVVARGEQPDLEIDIAVPDHPGVIATVAGALALHRLEIRALAAYTEGGWGLLTVAAHPRFGSGPDWALVRAEIARGLEAPGPLSARVAQSAAAYPPAVSAQPPAVSWVDAGVSEPILQVRAPDGLGVLHRIAAAIALADGDVHSARCQTLGADVVDTFSVAPLDAGARDHVARSVLAALA
jgi:[protein-PII] uridylyltransferase